MRPRVSKRVAFMAPFVLGPFLLRPSVPVLGDVLAGVIGVIAVPMAARPAPSEVPDAPSEPAAEPASFGEHGGRPRFFRSARVPRPVTSAAPDGGVAASPSDAGAPGPKGTIVVPASIVAQAIARKDVGATNAKGPDGKPLGARIHGVSRYHTGLRDGDVIVSVAGMPTPTTAALVECALRAAGAENGKATGRTATTLSGTIVRGDETWNVVLELPPPP